ncbi:hypothetical protein Sjap_007299 [Stephania japonica]|uniref:Uncharacterized protein n=1 Tax=Stephania japonica TaxID=461633 RepID=A0AAP0PDK7_9MAGN
MVLTRSFFLYALHLSLDYGQVPKSVCFRKLDTLLQCLLIWCSISFLGNEPF